MDQSSASFADIRTTERDYFRRTGCFPPQHLMILRREVWERDKWIARNLTDAFIRCNDEFSTAQRQFPYVSPWLDAELEETEALMGADFHPYGFEKNRETIDIFCRQAYDLGIVSRPISAGEYFAEFLDFLSSGRMPFALSTRLNPANRKTGTSHWG